MTNEYKQESQNKWQKTMIIIAANICVISFLAEIIIYFAFKLFGQIETSENNYLVLRVVMPSAFNMLMFCLMYYVKNVAKNEKIVKYKDDLMCLCLYAMCTIIAIVHNYYHVTWIIPALCQFINSIYADKAGLKRNYLYINIVLTIIIIFAFIEAQYETPYLIVTAVCAYAFTYVIYLTSTLLVSYNNEQLDYVRESYIRQKAILDELDIEPMTGIFNRNSLEKRIQKVINEKKSKNLQTYLVMLDLDHFKRINDIYGHTSGDDVIMRLVYNIRNIATNGVEAFRYGGEEFIIFFRNTPYTKVYEIVEKMRENFKKEKFSFDQNVVMTFSAGISGCMDGMNPEDLIKSADDALYKAKENGRDQIKGINI